jgi:hypothetical protein
VSKIASAPDKSCAAFAHSWVVHGMVSATVMPHEHTLTI